MKLAFADLPLRSQVAVMVAATVATVAAVLAAILAPMGAFTPTPYHHPPLTEIVHPAPTGVYVTLDGEEVAVDPAADLPAAVLDDLRGVASTTPGSAAGSQSAWRAILTGRVDALEAAGVHAVVVVATPWEVAGTASTYRPTVLAVAQNPDRPALCSPWPDADDAVRDARWQTGRLGDGWRVIDLTE